MRVVTYNIHGGVGVDRRRRPERIAEVLAGLEADIIGLQEVEGRRSRSKIDQAHLLAERLGCNIVEGPLLQEAHGAYGNVLLTRYPIIEIRRRLFVRPGSHPRGLIDVDLDHPALGPLRVIVTHLEVRDHRIRSTQLLELKQLVEGGPPGPIVVMGDLNEWWRRRPALLALHRAAPFLISPPTFPSRLPLLRLDRIAARGLQTPGGDGHAHRVENRLTRIASDHLPLLAEFTPLPA